mmetsp:Transcript_27701/g.90217  ORF Transcript_27701/g.90217 Transcript_27701/m.90217 type:complete len:218 (-) Transcript_27701:277-930(-)
MNLHNCLRTSTVPFGVFLFLFTQNAFLLTRRLIQRTPPPQDMLSCCSSVCRSNTVQRCQGVPQCWAWTTGQCCRRGCSCRWKTGKKICKVNKNNGELSECKENNISMEYDGCIEYTDGARKGIFDFPQLIYIVPGVSVLTGAVYLLCMRMECTTSSSENLPEIRLQPIRAPVQRKEIWDESVPPIAFDLYVSGVVLSMETPKCTTERPEQYQDKKLS